MAMPPVAPVTPNAMPLREVLDRSEPLALLRHRLRESEARFAVVCASLPAALAAHLRPGPVDAAGWTLLAANPAVAAKLRQLQPRLEAALLAHGWPAAALRIKVQAP
jgi:hypothetical protein